MATVVSFNGGSFTIPSIGEEDWGGNSKVDGFLIAVANNALPKSGGSFTLTAEVDFGGLFGQKSLYYKSRGSNTATLGVVRLASGESIAWRNADNTQNLEFKVNNSNQLEFNGTPITTSGGVVLPTAGGTGFASYTVGDLLFADTTSTLGKLLVGAIGTVLQSDGTVPSWSKLTNTNIDPNAAIDRSKIANGTAGHVLINNGAGGLSSEAQLSKSRGGCGADMSGVAFPSSGTIVTTTGFQTLTNKVITRRVVSLSDGATISINASLGDVYRVTLSGNRTLANPTNLVDGQTIQVQVKQDGAGSRTLNYGTMYRFSTDLPQPTLSVLPNTTDRLLFEYNGLDGTLDLVAINKGYL